MRTLSALLTFFLAPLSLTACQSDEPLTTSEIVELVRPSTVLVKALQDGEPVSSGSGWVVDADKGLIATNFHVTGPGEAFLIALDRDGRKRPAKFVAAAPCDDIAVLRVSDTKGLKSLPVADQSALKTGEKVITLGFPGNVSQDQLQVTEGIISVKRTQLKAGKSQVRGWPNHPNLVQMDAALNPGNSGGPTVDETGALIGMNTFVGPPGQGYAIGGERLRKLLPSLAQGKSQAWGGFGFTFDSELLIVTSVFPNTPADEATLEPGEGILYLDGLPIDNMQDYCDVAQRSGNDPVEAEVIYDFSDYYGPETYFSTLRFNGQSDS